MENPVRYFEIPVLDLERAITFYATVFGWQFERVEIDGNAAFLQWVAGAAQGVTAHYGNV